MLPFLLSKQNWNVYFKQQTEGKAEGTRQAFSLQGRIHPWAWALQIHGALSALGTSDFGVSVSGSSALQDSPTDSKEAFSVVECGFRCVLSGQICGWGVISQVLTE